MILGIVDLEEEESESQLANSQDCELLKRTCGSIILQILVGIKRVDPAQWHIERSCEWTVDSRADRVGRMHHLVSEHKFCLYIVDRKRRQRKTGLLKTLW
jgi:hypothetical protein